MPVSERPRLQPKQDSQLTRTPALIERTAFKRLDTCQKRRQPDRARLPGWPGGSDQGVVHDARALPVACGAARKARVTTSGGCIYT